MILLISAIHRSLSSEASAKKAGLRAEINWNYQTQADLFLKSVYTNNTGRIRQATFIGCDGPLEWASKCRARQKAPLRQLPKRDLDSWRSKRLMRCRRIWSQRPRNRIPVGAFPFSIEIGMCSFLYRYGGA